jgi:hypothetical protein
MLMALGNVEFRWEMLNLLKAPGQHKGFRAEDVALQKSKVFMMSSSVPESTCLAGALETLECYLWRQTKRHRQSGVRIFNNNYTVLQ